jgi:hypothetical protein
MPGPNLVDWESSIFGDEGTLGTLEKLRSCQPKNDAAGSEGFTDVERAITPYCISDFLVPHGLGQFVSKFHEQGIDSAEELKRCPDFFLVKIGMKPAHIVKFRRACTIGLKMDLYEASDGFRGTFDEVKAHEQNLADAKHGTMSVYEASDGFRGNYEEVVAHEQKIKDTVATVSLYEADDGFRGTLEEVMAHEQNLADAKHGTMSLYEAADGFRGTYDQVVEHQKAVMAKTRSGQNICGFSNGSLGKLEDAVTHEKKLATPGSTGLDLYEAEDGFRGTYGEVLAHEKGIHGGASSRAQLD